jgi:hypothetical protein
LLRANTLGKQQFIRLPDIAHGILIGFLRLKVIPHQFTGGTLLLILSTAPPVTLGIPEGWGIIHIPSTYFVPCKAHLMLGKLPSNKDGSLDMELESAVCKGTPMVVGSKVPYQFIILIFGILTCFLGKRYTGCVDYSVITAHVIHQTNRDLFVHNSPLKWKGGT